MTRAAPVDRPAPPTPRPGLVALRILGTGSMRPGAPVPSDRLDRDLGLAPGHLQQRTGVATRHFAQTHSQIDMAATAAQAALDDAGLDPGALDLILSASAVAYQTLPATAPLLMRALGLRDGAAACFDVNSSCTSFLSALDIAARQIATGAATRALIVSSEIASRGLPWRDAPETAALFGDGAAAVVLGPADQPGQGIRASLMRSYPSHYDDCEIAAGGTRIDFHADPEAFCAGTTFRMDGKSLFAITLRQFPGFVRDLLAQAGWSPDSVDCIVPHQASPHALGHMARQTGFEPARIIDISRSTGNQIAASIPTALDHARRSGRAGPGQRLLLLGTSAGVSFAGIALQT